MKIETSENGPKLNLLKPDGVRNQTSGTCVNRVLLDGVGWVRIQPGSFHFYKTAGDKPVPFVQFDLDEDPCPAYGPMGLESSPYPYRVEVFPTAIAGLAYPVTDEVESGE